MAKAHSQNTAVKDEILTASMPSLVWKLAPVAVIAFSINSINTFIDALFVGQFLGEKALAGISLAFPLTMITNAFAAMLGIGGSSLLSRSLGSGDTDTQKKILSTNLILGIVISIILMIGGWILADEMIMAIGGEGEVLELGTAYFRILILGAFFQIFAVVMNFLIRAEGKIKTAMTMTMTSVVVNMILNPLFLGYFKMGIEGTAYATIASMAALMAMGLFYYTSDRASYEVDLKNFTLDSSIVKPVLAVGVSAMMLQLMFLIQNAVVFKMVSTYGDDWDIAFMGACYRCLMLMIIPGIGFSVAVQPVIGMNYGAGQYDRVKRAFTVFAACSVGLTSILIAIFAAFPHQTLSLLMPDSTFSSEDIFHFRILIAPLFISSFFIIALNLYQSIGRARLSGIMTVLREIVFFVPVVIFLPRWIGLTGIYAAGAIQNGVVFLIMIYFIVRLFRELSEMQNEVNMVNEAVK